jgi:RNA polymerase sigma-70 factor, ECF subfamily
LSVDGKSKKMLDEVLNISAQMPSLLPADEMSDGAEMSDARLAEAVVAGDEDAFQQIFDRHTRGVTRVVSRFFRDRSEVEELVQQSFTKAYFSLKSFRGNEQHSMTAWLTRIAVNICYDEFRRKQRRGERLFTEMSETENVYIEQLADGRAGIAESSIAAADLLEKIMCDVDPRDRIAMTLVYSDQLSLEEAAHAIGISSSNLKSRLYRCRNQLKTRFGHLFK